MFGNGARRRSNDKSLYHTANRLRYSANGRYTWYVEL